MQAKMHLCAAKCCQDKSNTYEDTQRCVQLCSEPLNNVKRFVEAEFKTFQNRVDRCLMDCNDSIQDSMGPDPSPAEIQTHVKAFEKCAEKCLESHAGLVPKFLEKVKQYAKNYN
ncbi:protein FAM136A [Bemisia tabaci]